MSRAFRLLAISLLVLCALFPSTYGLENITVVSPPELQYLNPLFDSPAMFGIPSYQTAVSGRLIYVEPYDGCSPFNVNFAENDAVILLIDRGTCHFTTKVLNAQLIGSPVKAVIVADNTVEYFPPMMQDDGLGSRITIPSVMIRKAAADSLKTANLSVSAPTPVLMQMEWRVPRPDNIVTWELWTSSNNPATRELISTFGAVMDALGDRVQFTPYYYTLPGTGYDDPNMRGSLSGDLCTNNNRYCTDSPVPVTSGGRPIMSGLPVVQLNVLHVCLWRYLVSQNQQRLWWSVMNEWNNVVFETAGSFDKEHLFAAMTQYSIPVKPITDCLAASGGISSSSTTQNTIAVDMINNATQRRVIMPAVYANGDVYRGSFSCPSPPSLDSCGVLQYICNNFRQDSSLPSACAKTGCPIGQVKDNCGVCNGKNLCQETPASSGVKTEAVVGVIIVIVFVLVAGGVYWNRRHQQQMRSDLDNILATYVRIDENGQARRPTEKNLPLSIHQDRSREGDDQATDNIRLL